MNDELYYLDYDEFIDPDDYNFDFEPWELEEEDDWYIEDDTDYYQDY